MILDHKNAVLARLRADSALVNKVHDGIVQSPDGKPVEGPYCVVYVNGGDRQEERLLGGQTRANFTFTIHSVGKTPEEAQAVVSHVYKQLLGFTPMISGRVCWPIRSVVTQATRLDKDVLPPMFYAVDEFTLSSSKA